MGKLMIVSLTMVVLLFGCANRQKMVEVCIEEKEEVVFYGAFGVAMPVQHVRCIRRAKVPASQITSNNGAQK